MSSDYLNEVLSTLLDQENLKGAKKEKVLNLIDRYFLYYNSGSLGYHAQELKDDASYSLMIQALWNYNYGPWMKEMIETTRHSARELEIIFTGASRIPTNCMAPRDRGRCGYLPGANAGRAS